ncbi:hypothetical protein [Plesiomonas sp.]|uniref:hypothetical protein n=1 Tax=Plesiomonas sp. TaxID=2486279 RepID=UPI003F2A4744
MNKFIYSLFVLSIPCTALAENNISMLIHGSSIHTGCEQGKGKKAKTCDLNGFNPGLGVDWVVVGDQDSGKLSVRSGVYYDSLREMAYYAGGAYIKDWNIYHELRLGVGIQAGYLNGSGQHGLVALPLISLGYKKLNLEVSYAPKSGWGGKERRSNVTMFTLKWQF